jgi:hypothetical protein
MKADEMDGACGTYREKRNVCRIPVEKPEGKRPLRRSRTTFEDDIKMYLT